MSYLCGRFKKQQTIMKEFDLELAKAGHPVCTRDGNPIRIVCFDLKGTNYPIVAAMMIGDVENINQYTIKGEYYADGHEHPCDLMMASEVIDSEKIRKAVRNLILSVEQENLSILNITRSNVLAWLEKQGKLIDEYEDKLDRCACNYFNKGYKAGKKSSDRVTLMQEWSEEDSLQLDAAINIVANSGHTCTSDWLKSIKDKVQQQDTREKLVAIIDDFDKLQQKFK